MIFVSIDFDQEKPELFRVTAICGRTFLLLAKNGNFRTGKINAKYKWRFYTGPTAKLRTLISGDIYFHAKPFWTGNGWRKGTDEIISAIPISLVGDRCKSIA